MTTLRSILPMAALSIAAVMATSTPAAAESYRINSNSTSNIDLRICDRAARVSVRGDGDTDLDFSISDSSGNTVHSDYDTTDITFATLRPRSSGCENFNLRIQNLGNVYNMANVTIETVERANASSSTRGGENDGRNRAVSIRNRTGETLMYVYWSNTGNKSYGNDRLGSGVLSNGQDWNVTVSDGSGACLFDFKGKTSSGREIEERNIDVCSVSYVTID